jgi:radical SAM superfamily enzyme YgiQ (UPF0313 family)
MNPAPKPVVSINSLQVQTSFQAVPLGAASIVSSLRSDPAIAGLADVSLGDFSLEDDELSGLGSAEAGSRIARKIAETNPVIAGFSVYAWNRAAFEEAARCLKRLVPGVVTFAGGPEVTAAPDSFMAASGDGTDPGDARAFDCLLSGEGETSARTLVKSLLSGAGIPASLAVPNRAPSEDCASLPSPWLDGTLDSCRAVRECKGALWELARGCPYSCAYCYESKGDKKVRAFPLPRLEKELERFAKTGVERVFVLDPTYNASRDRALQILSLIERKAGDLHFNFEVRAEHLDRDMVASFSRIPCSLQIGLQSSNEEALRLVNRPCNLKEFSRKIGMLNEAGIVFGLDLMYGLPGDTLSSFRTSVDYAVSLFPNNLEIFRLAVLPGTALHDRAQDLGLKHAAAAPYHVESTPKFPAQDLERAASIARACDVFYTQGRAVTWFLSALHPIKLKPSQFFQDFARFVEARDTGEEYPHAKAEALQLEFMKAKYAEKGKMHLLPALSDVIALNGAWTRALAEGEETVLDLSYAPEDLFGADAMDLEYFTENACMERCSARVFPGKAGPDIEFL